MPSTDGGREIKDSKSRHELAHPSISIPIESVSEIKSRQSIAARSGATFCPGISEKACCRALLASSLITSIKYVLLLLLNNDIS